MAALALVGILGYVVYRTRDHQWFVVRYVVSYGGKLDPAAKVYLGSDGRLLVIVPAEDPVHPDSNGYVVHTRRAYVCSTGDPFWGKIGRFAVTSDPYPCEYVMNGVIEPPSFNAHLKIVMNRIEFTAFSGKRVVATREDNGP